MSAEKEEQIRTDIETKCNRQVGAVECRDGIWHACVEPEGWVPVSMLLKDEEPDELYGLIDYGL